MLRPAAGALLVRTVHAELPAPREGPADARRRAAEILSRPEFRPPPRSVIQRLLDLADELFRKVAGGLGGGSALVGWAIVGVVGVVAVVVFVVVARALQRDPGVGAGVAVDGVGRPPADWRAEAARHEAAGAWRDALRCHWRALVADLAARGLVEEVPGRTTGDYRRHVARAVPGAAKTFASATGLFEVAWYAAQEVDAAAVAEERRLGDQVLAEATR